MNLRRLWYWMWTTTLLGLASTALVSAVLMGIDQFFSTRISVGGYAFNFFNIFVTGMTFGVFAMMGFFAYLMVNYIALSIFRKPTIWRGVQIILTIVALVDLVVLPVYLLDSHHEWYLYLIFSDPFRSKAQSGRDEPGRLRACGILFSRRDLHRGMASPKIG